jgi:hypothetical protein
MSYWGRRALAHALGRTSPLRYFQLLLDRAADPALPSADGTLPAALAARTGRAGVLDLFAQHGFHVALTGDDAFLAACACGVRAACEQESRQLGVVRDACGAIDGALKLGRVVVGGMKTGVRAGPRVQQGSRRAQEALGARGGEAQIT